MNLKFRNVIQSDLEKFPVWYKRINGNQLFTHYIPSTFKSFENSKNLFWYIILRDDDEIGTIWFEPKEEGVKEYDLGIYLNHQKYFGQGIGKAAIRQAVDMIVSRLALKEIYLNVRKSNQGAVACYENVGFEIIEERIAVYGDKRVKFFRMRLDIFSPSFQAQ